MSDLVKRVASVRDFPQRYLEVTKDLDAHLGEFIIIRAKPDAPLYIFPDHWEDVVKPGWEVMINVLGLLPTVLLPEAGRNGPLYPPPPPPPPPPPSQPLLAPPPTTGSEQPIVDVSYVVDFYEMIRSNYSKVWTERSSDPITKNLSKKSNMAASILEEVRKVYRGNKMSSVRENSEIEATDIVSSPTLYVRSKMLLNALKAVIEFQSIVPGRVTVVPGWTEKNEEASLDEGVFVYPFQDLYHCKDDLLAYQGRLDSEERHTTDYNHTCKQHIDVLVQYLYAQEGMNLKEVEGLFSAGKTTFNCYWLLLKPGRDVYVRDERDQLNAYVIETVIGGPGVISGRQWAEAYTLLVWNMEFNGERLSRSTETVTVPIFSGEREIHTLPVFPTDNHKDDECGESLEESLFKRGQTYVEVVRSPSFQEYTGTSHLLSARMYDRVRVITDHKNQPWKLPSIEEVGGHQPCSQEAPTRGPGHPRQHDYSGHPLLDHYTLGSKTRVPECECQACTNDGPPVDHIRRRAFDDYDNIMLNPKDFLSRHQYFLCWSHVYAFILKDRLWDLLDVGRLSPPKINPNIIDTLVMKHEGNKDMVKAICDTFSAGQAQNLYFADSIQGKGEGQILLLHGPPGTGKTLTAESVAEYTGRPLLSITAADLGHEPIELEKKLLRFFRDANKWNAIVLLDEADVYLERRSRQDLTRNSIVSVFLRALDYFQGILFLTTNRVGSFDEAFMSRIHVQIGYDALDNESRFQIWKNHFKKLDHNHEFGGPRIGYESSAESYVMVSEPVRDLKWNGREIRNAVQTAVALASFEARQKGRDVPRITKSHIEQVVHMSQNFKNYMEATLQAEDSAVAHQDRLRDDRTKAAGP
ncbi:p-loop containing nucleoside triphosphate hydrolase [Diplodia corticola]|uniref:p-loop containing nucleoside triphosphate hydrolase n=1 Tax=Diplodia corticola TaxID=236234 RepID=A0A1J9QYB2_9PEZI|nr:p-loop containing nucleoside triphosphate hydrolase [Diplodia corticola]OJD34038.1 p-loop containing nucleoside triphosphate hydrolase [Diplodia corticola]